jgi:hypothetical protein
VAPKTIQGLAIEGQTVQGSDIITYGHFNFVLEQNHQSVIHATEANKWHLQEASPEE